MAQRVRSKMKQYSRMASRGEIRPIFQDFRRWIWSTDHAVGMARDLSVPVEPPPARVPIEISKLDESTAKRLFAEEGLDHVSVLDMESRRRFWEDRIPDAYVAVDDEGNPCYVQWAISGENAALVKSYFGEGFPDLGESDLLLEGAWARPEARGKRIMAEAMSRITVAGATPHHKRAITFVGVDNEPSIRGCQSAGFEVYIGRKETWRLGRRKVTWGAPQLT